MDFEKILYEFNLQFSKEEIKNNGIIFTPSYISNYLIEKINPTLEETFLEPFVGSGSIIISLLNFIKNKYNLNQEELLKYFKRNVFMNDINKQNIENLKTILSIYFNLKPTDFDIKNIQIKNTLKSTSNFYDIIVTNPPYVTAKNLTVEDLNYLKKHYKSCEKGKIDLYYACIEYCYKFSRRTSLIIPNSYITNKSAISLNNIIKNHIKEIIDFKTKLIFRNANTYTSILILTKEEQNHFEYKTDLNSPINRYKTISEINPLGKYLNKQITIHTPIATLRDKLFSDITFKNKDTIDFYKLGTIKSYEDFFKCKTKIIFPYIETKIKEEKDLQEETLSYLNSVKEELEKRDKGKKQYESWFAYGRKQGLNKYNLENDIIIIPNMFSIAYNFFKISLKEIKMPFVFSNGFLLECNKRDTKEILMFLNSNAFKEYLLVHGKVWSGNYYSLSKKQLKSLFE